MPPRHIKKIEEKRCIPKEGYATCPQGMSKKREEKNIAHTKNIQGREKSHKGVPPSSTKNIHTFAYLDQGL